jgi:L-proline amide hydrolase
MLAIDYLLTQPTGIQGVILASTIISVPLFQREMNGLRRKLPIKTQLTLKKHEKAGTIDDPEYMAAYKVFQKKHIFRQDTWPPHLAPPEGSFGTTVYRTMWGYSECCPNGSLTQWDRIGRLHEITAPTLITSGRYDEVTPSQAATTRQEIAGSRQELFEYSAHMAHIEEVGKYLEVTGSFLDATEQH